MTENKEHVLLLGGVYRDFNGFYYVACDIARNAETSEYMIIYRESNKEGLVQPHTPYYTRSVADWFKTIDGVFSDKVNTTGQKTRFEIENQGCCAGSKVVRTKERRE